MTRNRIISSLEDRKMIAKISEVEPFDDISAHLTVMEIYDTSPEVQGVISTHKYNYFSCFKDYQEAFRNHKP